MTSNTPNCQWDWDFWARPEQLLPAGEWLTWLVLAGRGFGKTRLGAEAIRKLVCGSTVFALTDSGEIWRYDEADRSWSNIPLPTEELPVN